jgi:hypothetical protein
MTASFDADRRRITALRLTSQGLVPGAAESPVDVVDRLLAVQAQDFPGALWSIGARSGPATRLDVLAAFDRGELVRSWPMRGTLHVVRPGDLRWLLTLTSERMTAATATRRARLGIAEADLHTARAVAEERLGGGRSAVRAELFAAFEAAGQVTAGQRGAHLVVHLAQTGVIVLGPTVDGSQAFVLLDEWVPDEPVPDREQALDELVVRFVTGHGPATVADLGWWSGLTLGEVRAAVARTQDRVERSEIGGVEYLVAGGVEGAAASALALPGFDEYLLGYRDRSAPLRDDHWAAVVPGSNGMFMPTIVVDGEVVGLWRRTASKRETTVELLPFGRLSVANRRRIGRSIETYGRFLDQPVRIVES